MVYVENPKESTVRINKSIWQVCWIQVNVVFPYIATKKTRKLKIKNTTYNDTHT